MKNGKKKRAAQILESLQQEFPDAGTMLDFGDTFQLLVAVVLSAQSTDAQVNRVTSQVFSRYQTASDFAAANLEELEEAIRGGGLFRTKASNIQKIARILLEQYQGQVPGDFEELLKMPGIGRKTAYVMMSVGFNKPGLGVDTHVHRVSNRLGLVAEKTADKTELALKAIIPRQQWSQAHHLLIFHGRQTCLARRPKCPTCVINSLCDQRL
ncbi:MAG: endonuclease III [Syntrophomonadaceae bacterium]|nr:endonuclease III [Syntrophomonadaceae bacterium]